MTGTELVPSRNALTQYGDRDVIKELGDRCKRFLPNGSKMSQEEALSFAQTALALDLNPFAHEVWYIPGMGIVTGIAGYRKLARRQGPFVAETRRMTPEEREKHNLKDGDIGAVCELYRPDQILDAVKVNEAAGMVVIPIKPTAGIGIRRPGERNKTAPKGRSLMWVAEKRAEADALRKAFDMTISFADNGTQTGDEVYVIEGEAVDEPEVQLSDWAVEALKEEKAPPSKEEAGRLRAILHGPDEDDWDAPKVQEAPADEPEPEPENEPEEATANVPDLPTTWQPFVRHAMDNLGYRSIMHVRDTLHEQGIERICTALGALEFDPLDGWTLLQDQAPEPKAQQSTML